MTTLRLGLSEAELQAHIQTHMTRLDEAQDEADHVGPYGDLLRLSAQIAYQRAAELILINNERLAEQLASMNLTERAE